jgi:YHS domain-containing protein
MSALEDLDRRIRERLAVNEEAGRQRRNHVEQAMHDWEERHRRYGATADRLIETIIRPRLERLKDHFPNARVPQEWNSRHNCSYLFERTDRFPATVRLELGVTRDGAATELVVEYLLSILPVFFPFQESDEIRFTLAEVEDDKVAAWIEDKLLQFVDTYLRLETAPPYQEENIVTDPVCGMRLNRLHAPASLEHRGVVYHFCVERCREAFAADPERYLAPKASRPSDQGGGR